MTPGALAKLMPIPPAELFHIVAFLIAMIVVWWMTPLINHIGLKTGYVDKPNERSEQLNPC